MINFYFNVIVVFTLSCIGYGTTILIIPNEYKKNYILFIPWIGTVLIMLISITASLAKEPITRSRIIVLFVAFLSLGIIYVLKKSLFPITRYSIYVFFLVIVGIFFLSLYYHNAVISAKIVDAQYYTKVSLVENLMNNISFNINNINIGPAMITGFFILLLKSHSIIFLNNLLFIYSFLSYPLFLILVQSVYRKNKISVILITYSIWILIMKFFIRTLDISLYIGIMLMLSLYLKSYFQNVLKKVKPVNLDIYHIAIGMFLSSLTVILPVYFKLIFILVVFLFMTVLLITRKKQVAISLLKIIVILLLINPLMTGIALGIR